MTCERTPYFGGSRTLSLLRCACLGFFTTVLMASGALAAEPQPQTAQTSENVGNKTVVTPSRGPTRAFDVDRVLLLSLIHI